MNKSRVNNPGSKNPDNEATNNRTEKPHFNDHFSQHAAIYAQFRPTYPPELFASLSSLCTEHNLAWDCATGSGQSALLLTPYFQQVIASDASCQQLNYAKQHPKVHYLAASAENSALKQHSVDLICVAQAAHWFNLEAFYQECRRVAKPGTVLALICYQLMQVEPLIDRLVFDLYENQLGKFWPAERRHIEAGYQSIAFPFEEVTLANFSMTADWSLATFLGYLQSWSAFQKFIKQHPCNPEQWLKAQLAAAWGDATKRRKITWPLAFRVGFVQ